jgi:hypothetical protein
LAEIGEVLGVTRERVRQRIERGLEMLSRWFGVCCGDRALPRPGDHRAPPNPRHGLVSATRRLKPL